MITVGDIRKAIEGLPDDAPAVVYIRPKAVDGGDGGPNIGRHVATQGVKVEPHTPRLEIDI